MSVKKVAETNKEENEVKVVETKSFFIKTRRNNLEVTIDTRTYDEYVIKLFECDTEDSLIFHKKEAEVLAKILMSLVDNLNEVEKEE